MNKLYYLVYGLKTNTDICWCFDSNSLIFNISKSLCPVTLNFMFEFDDVYRFCSVAWNILKSTSSPIYSPSIIFTEWQVENISNIFSTEWSVKCLFNELASKDSKFSSLKL